jgi:enoyl-CoA hydratase
MAGDYQTLIYEKQGARALITFNRPHILNAVAMEGAHEVDALAERIAADADIRIVTIKGAAKLGLPAIKEGLIPGLGTLRLARYIGLGRAKRLIITGEMIDGTQGERMGMVDYLVAEDSAEAEFEKIIERVAAVNSKGCRLSKEMLTSCYDLDFETFFSLYKERQLHATNSDDFAEAMTAYNEKRQPVWG